MEDPVGCAVGTANVDRPPCQARLGHLLSPLHPFQLGEQGLHARLQPADRVGVAVEGGQG